MKIKIKITKEVLKRSMWCGTKNDLDMNIGSNCVVACAIVDIFPKAWVYAISIAPFYYGGNTEILIPIPQEASAMINKFDNLYMTPEERLNLPEMEFEIDVPNEVIERIDISDIHKSQTLEVVL